MQGVHALDPKAKVSIDLESFVAEDHFLRQIDRVLDLSFVRELTATCYADGKGRPSIDPEVFFRMQLVAYFNGITKDRRLCEEVPITWPTAGSVGCRSKTTFRSTRRSHGFATASAKRCSRPCSAASSGSARRKGW